MFKPNLKNSTFVQFISSKRRQIIFLPLFLFLFASCGVWQDFTTYFNLYYNITDLFEKVENGYYQEQSAHGGIFAIEEEPLPANLNADIIKVIEKSSNLLQFHSTSSYVDDVLYILGKCFYYQHHYPKALRKFNELLAAQPESDLALNTKLWAAKCEMRIQEYEKALQVLESVKQTALDEGEYKILADAFSENVRYNIIEENYDAAIKNCNEILKFSDDNVFNAEVAFNMGLFYMHLEDYDNAEKSFLLVDDYSPAYKVEFNTLLERTKALRKLGKYEEAFLIYERMRKEQKFFGDLNKIEIEYALALIENKNYEEAFNKFSFIDTAFTTTETAGIARYKIGELFENHYNNYDSAQAYYKKALNSSVPVEYREFIIEKISLFNRYFELSKNHNKYQGQIAYAENPELFVSDSIAYYDALKKEQMEKNREMLMDGDAVIEEGTGKIIPLEDPKTEDRDREKDFDEKGVGNFGKNNDRNQNTQLKNQTTDLSDKIGSPPQRPKLSLDSLKSLVVKNEFELGNLFFTELNRPDSSFYYYLNILTHYPYSGFHARILYSLGSYYELINQEDKADSLFEIVYNNYQEKNIVNAAAVKLGKPLIEIDFDPAGKSYAKGEKNLSEEKFDSSVVIFYSIYEEYPNSSFAPKALYAAGWVLENKINLYDSAASVYATLITRYPKTKYASAVAQKINLYKQSLLQKSALETKKNSEETIKTTAELIKNKKDNDKGSEVGFLSTKDKKDVENPDNVSTQGSVIKK